MPDGPAAVLSLQVTSDGTALPDTARILAVETWAEVNRIPEARIVLGDGDVATGEFPMADGSLLKPGAEVTVAAGYGGEVETIFEGMVTGQRLRIAAGGEPRLEIRCHAKAIKLTLARKSDVHVNKKDSDVVTTLLSAAGLTADVEATSYQWPELVQHRTTDWDFILARAKANGLLVIASGGKVEARAPGLGEAAAVAFEYGSDVLRLDLDLDAREQHQAVKARSWDPANLQMVEAAAGPGPQVNWGDLAATTLSDVGTSEIQVECGASVASGVLGTVAAARRLRSSLARMRGEMRVLGTAGVAPGKVVELRGVGSRFGGKPFVTGVAHRIEAGGWVTDLTLGLPPSAAASPEGGDAPRAAGLVPPVSGLQVGTVTEVADDPDGAARIKVDLPLLGGNKYVWARMATPHATNEAGFQFLPEAADEVVLGFLDDDPDAPIVLGALWGKKNKPPETPATDNHLKTIVTRKKLRIDFDDEKKRIVVETPGGNRVTLDDEGKTVIVEDLNRNKVTLGETGIAIDTPKDFKLDAKGAVSISAASKVEIASAGGDVEIKGLNVKAVGQVGFSGQGSAQAELKSSGQTAVKGSIVMIN